MNTLPPAITLLQRLGRIVFTTGIALLLLYTGGLTILLLLEELFMAWQGYAAVDYDVLLLIVRLFFASFFFMGAAALYAAIQIALTLRSNKPDPE